MTWWGFIWLFVACLLQAVAFVLAVVGGIIPHENAIQAGAFLAFFLSFVGGVVPWLRTPTSRP